MVVEVDSQPKSPGFESRKSHDFFFILDLLYFFVFFLSLLLQCKFANSTLLSLLSFSYFITPYDAQASSAFSALIIIKKTASSASLNVMFSLGLQIIFQAADLFRFKDENG